MNDWRKMESAPKGKSIMLCTSYGTIYCGQERYGTLGEPSQEMFAWRCDSSGRYATPTHWMELPPLPPKEPK